MKLKFAGDGGHLQEPAKQLAVSMLRNKRQHIQCGKQKLNFLVNN